MTNSVLDRIKQNNFEDLAGASLSFKVPLTRAFLNWNVQRSLPDKIESIKIRSIQGRIIVLNIETMIPLLPVFDITVELYEILPIPQLELKMKIVDGLGWLARNVADKLLPDGMDIDGKTLIIDLHQILFKNTKYKTLVDKITYARFTGAKDKLLLEFELHHNPL